jgi:predicted NAD/FAD-dependent oxidoreductase
MVNLAIIGAGIGGCSAAYFAHKYLPDSKVTVYEREDRVGGRVFTFNTKKMRNEIGASFFHPINRTVCGIVKEMNLNVTKFEEPMDIAVFDGTEIVFQSGQSKFFMMLKLLTKYKLNVLKILLSLREAEGKIEKWYEKESPVEFWELFESVDLDEWYRMPFDQILAEMGVDKNFVDEMVTPITRIIYSQNAELGGFAGLTSLLGVYGESMYSLEDGNDVLPKKLLEASNSKLKLGCKVESVEKTSKGSFRVSSKENASVFDGVIVAAPLEVADISFDGVANQEKQAREYQKIYIKIMQGTVDSRYFNLDASSKLPSIILTSKDADPITRFSINESAGDESWVTVTSTEPIGNSLLDELFRNGRTILDHTWKAAYPVFKPIPKIPSTCLDKGLIYLNVMESAASSLESSAFAALNSIRAVKEQLVP